MSDKTEVYTWEFLNEIVGWTKYIALGMMVGSFYLTKSYKFAATFLIGATFDILTLMGVIDRGKKLFAGDFKKGSSVVVSLIAFRLGIKALLLAAAAFMPQVFNLWGMVFGVLIVDTTILIVGSVKTAMEIWR